MIADDKTSVFASLRKALPIQEIKNHGSRQIMIWCKSTECDWINYFCHKPTTKLWFLPVERAGLPTIFQTFPFLMEDLGTF